MTLGGQRHSPYIRNEKTLAYQFYSLNCYARVSILFNLFFVLELV